MRKDLLSPQILNKTGITFKETAVNFFVPLKQIGPQSTTYKNFVKNGNKRFIENEYISMEIRNRLLLERHRKIVRSVIKHGTTTLDSKGKFITFFKSLDILKANKMGEKNHKALKEDLKHIADAKYYIKVGTYQRMVSIFKEHEIEDNFMGEKVHAVEIDENYIKMYATDLSASGDRIFDMIEEIDIPTIPSIVLNIIYRNRTNKYETYHLEDILNSIGFTMESPMAVRTVKKNLKDNIEMLKKDFGIIYDYSKKTFTYKKIEEIEFLEEKEITEELLSEYKGKIINYDKKERIIYDIVKDKPDGTQWRIKTEKNDIVLKYFLDDLLFLLNRITTENTKTLQGLFALE